MRRILPSGLFGILRLVEGVGEGRVVLPVADRDVHLPIARHARAQVGLEHQLIGVVAPVPLADAQHLAPRARVDPRRVGRVDLPLRDDVVIVDRDGRVPQHGYPWRLLRHLGVDGVEPAEPRPARDGEIGMEGEGAQPQILGAGLEHDLAGTGLRQVQEQRSRSGRVDRPQLAAAVGHEHPARSIAGMVEVVQHRPGSRPPGRRRGAEILQRQADGPQRDRRRDRVGRHRRGAGRPDAEGRQARAAIRPPAAAPQDPAPGPTHARRLEDRRSLTVDAPQQPHHWRSSDSIIRPRNADPIPKNRRQII